MVFEIRVVDLRRLSWAEMINSKARRDAASLSIPFDIRRSVILNANRMNARAKRFQNRSDVSGNDNVLLKKAAAFESGIRHRK